jgi:hypothetical protein
MDLAKTGERSLADQTCGPEPLGNGFNEAYLVEAFAAKNTPLKLPFLINALSPTYLRLQKSCFAPASTRPEKQKTCQGNVSHPCADRARCP